MFWRTPSVPMPSPRARLSRVRRRWGCREQNIGSDSPRTPSDTNLQVFDCIFSLHSRIHPSVHADGGVVSVAFRRKPTPRASLVDRIVFRPFVSDTSVDTQEPERTHKYHVGVSECPRVEVLASTRGVAREWDLGLDSDAGGWTRPATLTHASIDHPLSTMSILQHPKCASPDRVRRQWKGWSDSPPSPSSLRSSGQPWTRLWRRSKPRPVSTDRWLELLNND